MKCRLHTFLLILITCATIPLSALGSVDNNRFQKANAAYSSNDFGMAIEIYESLITDHGYASGVLYNLANSYVQIGKVGRAVVNYERALKLKPGDSDITGNLQLVRDKNGLFSTEATVSERLLHIMDMNTWIALGGFGVLLATCTLLFAMRSKLAKPAVTMLITCSLSMIVLSILSTTALHNDWNSSVVVDSKARLQISPFAGAATAGDIREGRKVLPKKKHGEYVFVEDETGRTGWIVASAIEAIIPK